jgi:tetratricopeptide (TPR) repeat protein
VPVPTAIPAQDEDLARRRRFDLAKVAVASLFVLVLLYLGLQGRQYARTQAKLDDITRVRHQLELAFDYEQGLPERFPDGLGNTNTIASRPAISTPQARRLLNALHTLLQEFYYKGRLSDVESLELRLSQATLANAEQRFADALNIITGQDEQGERPRTEAQLSRALRVLQIRGDALYGLQKWEDALERYRKALRLQPDRVATIARLAECQAALGKRDEALLTYAELAKVHAVRGDAHLLQGNPDSAVRHYQHAAWIYATSPHDSSREGGKAREFALKACELSEWKSFGPIEALAAACAETGNFADAIKWQQRALELAPGKYKPEIGARLHLYQAGKPYRS